MEDLINRLKGISNLNELENINNINANTLIYLIIRSNRYDLLKNSNIRLNINDRKTLEKLIDYLLSDDDALYYMHQNGFSFSNEELNRIFIIVVQKYQDSYEFDTFLRDFFLNKEELNTFIKEHKSFFKKYIHDKKQSVYYGLKDCDSFIELVLRGNYDILIGNLEEYSSSNLKLLVQFMKLNKKLPYYLGNDRFAQHLFDLKNDLAPGEFFELLNLFVDKVIYDRKIEGSELTSFSTLVYDNIDFLIELVSQTKMIPKCLIESSIFRDECIKRNRIDLAVKCVLPANILENESLINAYCKELNIDSKVFYERSKWLLNYHKKNNNVFNTFLATSLKDKIFNLNSEHFERFINDVEVQISLAKLNNNELDVLSKILDIYNYEEYDISLMIVNVLNNIGHFHELIDSLNLDNVSEQDLRKLVAILQFSNNQYEIKSLRSLHRYDEIKKAIFEKKFGTNNLITNKNNLLKLVFNIDLDEAQYIDSKYCHNNDNENVFGILKNSELPSYIYDYLELINRIVECDNQEKLLDLYNDLRSIKVYNSEIPFEAYLRAKYTELYSKSLYRINERNQVYGPKDSITKEVNYNGKNIQVCIPRSNFNFFVHCVGSCSLASEVIEKNYRNDWLYRPQLQDHFVACSYINEKGINSIRSQGSIIFGFDTLESGSILGMGNTDIDSIGRYSCSYDGSRELQEENEDRARFFVPSEIIKTINKGYNEIVVERRNTDYSRSSDFKRKPDYIIMMVESMEPDNFNNLENLYQNQLSFISEEDKKEIQQIGNATKLKSFLVKYKENISQIAKDRGILLNDMANIFVDLIMKAKYYEDCLKASSEFDIPLVIIDKTYYFNKILFESDLYDEETRKEISDYYSQAGTLKKKELFNLVAQSMDVMQVMKPKAISNNILTI